MAAVVGCLVSCACQEVPYVNRSLCYKRHCWRNHTRCLYGHLEVNSALCTHVAASPQRFSNLLTEACSYHGDPGELHHQSLICMQLGSKGRKHPTPLLHLVLLRGPPLWRRLSAAFSPLLKCHSLPDIPTNTPRTRIWH